MRLQGDQGSAETLCKDVPDKGSDRSWFWKHLGCLVALGLGVCVEGAGEKMLDVLLKAVLIRWERRVLFLRHGCGVAP